MFVSSSFLSDVFLRRCSDLLHAGGEIVALFVIALLLLFCEIIQQYSVAALNVCGACALSLLTKGLFLYY